MESSGAVTSIREARIPDGPVSGGRKKMNTPNLLATPLPGPRTREEIVKFQLEAVKLVAGKLKEGMAWGEVREVDIALDSAQKARGIWPKAEFLARLSTGLLFRAIPEFERIEAFRAVA